MFALMFALARMASAAWVGAAVLFVAVAIKQTIYYTPPEPGEVEDRPVALAPVTPARDNDPPSDRQLRNQIVARLALMRFPFYYYTGAGLLGTAFVSSFFLRRRYLKYSRWMIVMVCLAAACGMLGYDRLKVYPQLAGMTDHRISYPELERNPEFDTLHWHSELVNGSQLLLTFVASFLLCLPGTRPDSPSILVTKSRDQRE
jgi:hypothetical protein